MRPILHHSIDYLVNSDYLADPKTPTDLNATRGKRQTDSSCSEYEFRCGDGSCIEDYQECNGAVECPDGSDETLESCVENL